jgi:protein disulfide-isomerase A6
MIGGYTDWVADCKALAPTWEKLADDFASESSVLIAKVDAEAENSKALAEEQEVQSYPTIKYFPKGSKKAQMYEGGRTEKDFVEFLNANAGTNRLVGGGLNEKAGTIEVLDTIVAKYTSGGSLKDIAAEVQKAAQTLKDKYSDYYVKVLTKLGTSQNYATKELSRLEGLLKKGGLAPEKLDDLTSRSNILRKFIPAQDESKQEL